MPPQVVRPDSILKRAEELITAGQSEAALQTLYNLITSKRTRSVLPLELEPIALLFVELAVSLRNVKLVKDGLHQYKKNVQTSTNGLQSVETVVKKFIELSESKLNEAQIKADTVAVEEDDLEAAESPESILLSAVSTDDSKDRSDRELITPWLRFLWEGYRTVLDILRNNSKLELTYHKIVLQAFQFCYKFNRKTEFHRLCDLLRQHIQSATIYQKQQDYVAVNHVDLTDVDTLQRYLELRFQQLNFSVKLELWQESFRSVEDVHTLLSSSKRQTKPHMMVNYYENLAKIFAVSDNALFHAAAWQKFFNLYSQSPTATEAEIKHYASVFLLSTLAIPPEDGSGSSNVDFVRSKNFKLTSLLNLPKIPTRDSLIQSILNRGILNIVDPSLAKLYSLLEKSFHPLTLAKEIQPSFEIIEANVDLKKYAKPLSEVTLTKLFQQVSEIYESIKLDFLVELATFKSEFQKTPIEIENFLVNAGQKGLLSVKIDHDAKVVSFRTDPFEEKLFGTSNLQPIPAELVHSLLANLAQTLVITNSRIDPSIALAKEVARKRALELANKEFDAESKEVLSRFNILEERQRKLDEARRIKEEEEIRLRQEKAIAEKRAEQERIEQEAIRRRKEKLLREQEAIKEKEKKKIAEEINAKGIIKIDVDKLEDLDADKLRLMQVEQLTKDKKDLETKLRSLAKKMDHTERAYRRYELPLLAKDAELQKEKDKEIYEETKTKIIAQAKKEHESAIKLRDRLQKVVPDFEKFRAEVGAQKHEQYLAKVAELKAKLEAARQERISQVIAERKAFMEEELRNKKEAERRAAEEEEILKQKAEERRKREEAIEKQREIEQLALQKNNSTKRVASPSASASTGAGAAEAIPSDRPLSFAEKMRLKREQQQREGSNASNTSSPRAPASSLSPASASSKVASPSPAPAKKELTFSEKMKLKRAQEKRL
ncbi:hypothetical protein PACTADRAFT_48746 [Pachysolen tannophilus NRRL Y-2460]|uniref:Eukaryotic translation initiation factor 3 subunit A n=1 Tax=Pachysolen tannophilus NRRL Y-2460 TaxID=669874 RepID=A0A1E4TYY9_PACTA|nr:hypothetical protein PACTADRAFT_48746 [Pachysolen tannophilus NRRL Y-2460]